MAVRVKNVGSQTYPTPVGPIAPNAIIVMSLEDWNLVSNQYKLPSRLVAEATDGEDLTPPGLPATPASIPVYRATTEPSGSAYPSSFLWIQVDGSGVPQKVSVRSGSNTLQLIDVNALVDQGIKNEWIGLARTPEILLTGARTLDSNDVVTNSNVVWPDGDTGVYTAVADTTIIGATKSYTITKVNDAVTKTFTQTDMTRNVRGVITNRPAITVA